MGTLVLDACYSSWKIYKGCKPSDLWLDMLSYVCYAFFRYVLSLGNLCRGCAFQSPGILDELTENSIKDDGTVRVRGWLVPCVIASRHHTVLIR
jgi:hypothetical protein